MARTAKREKELTIEEKLEQALVPEVERPYPVPRNWRWVKWGDVGKFVAGSTFKNAYQGKIDYSIPFYKVGSLKYTDKDGYLFDVSNTVNEKMRCELKAHLIPKDSIVFAKIGEAIKLNRRSISKTPCCIDNNMMAFIPMNVLLRYVYYWSKSIDLYDYANATTVPAIRKSDLESIEFPLPPLAEQQRIVDRIESLFAKLDEAKEKAQAVVDSFEDRKAAILHEAFIGELTAEWRKENGISIESWFSQNIKESCTIGSGGTPSRKNPDFYNGDIPWVKTGEIDWNDIYDTEEHISLIATNSSSAKVFPEGSVLVAMYGMGVTRGRAAILRVNAATNQAVCVLQPNEYLINRYLFYYFMRNYWDIREQAVGGNQLNLSGTIISTLTINIPSVDEQYEIIKILDLLFEKEQRIKETSEQVIDQIDIMKKSILARAFRGELGTNEPMEESALELLKQTL